MDEKTNEAKKPNTQGPVTRDILYAEAAKHAPRAIEVLVEQMDKGDNSNAKIGAAKSILAKAIPDLKALEVSGGYDELGNKQSIQLLINTGQGFIPATIKVSSSPAGGVTTEPGKVQSSDLAQESPKDIHSDNGSSQAGTS